MNKTLRFLVLLTCAAACPWMANAMDTAFSYQGRLDVSGLPANGDYDFRFILYDAEIGGSQVGPILYGDDITVVEGLFTVYLDFGSGIFTGGDRWLEVSVRPGSESGTYTPLQPRQSVLPTPYALHTGHVSWNEMEDIPPGFADGVDDEGDGDITGVLAGSGLSGGGSNGEVTLSIGSESVTSNHLAANSVYSSEIGANAVGSTEIINGSITSSDINSNSVQARVSGSCGIYRSIKSINNAGAVTCEYDDFNSVGRTTVYSASAINGATNYAIVGATNSVCFLTQVHFRDVDASNEDVWCQVFYESSNPPNTWVLEAHSEDDADAWCAMRCVTWTGSRVD